MEKPPKRLKPNRVYALDSDKMKFRYTTKNRAGGNGFGLSDEGCSYTLNTIDQHMVAVIYDTKKSPTGREQQGFRQGGEALWS